jgi:hypothetical protein
MLELQTYLELIEKRLAIEGCLTIFDDKIIPSKSLTKKEIKLKMWDDLFQFHDRKLIFTNRFMSFVADITDRKVLTGHYHLELRK